MHIKLDQERGLEPRSSASKAEVTTIRRLLNIFYIVKELTRNKFTGFSPKVKSFFLLSIKTKNPKFFRLGVLSFKNLLLLF